jgi:hypothetical protein
MEKEIWKLGAEAPMMEKETKIKKSRFLCKEKGL